MQTQEPRKYAWICIISQTDYIKQTVQYASFEYSIRAVETS